MFKQDFIEPIFSEKKIRQRIGELARDIYSYYAAKGEDFWILYPEKGARVFAESLQEEIVKLEGRKKIYQGLIPIVASRTRGTGFLDEVRLENFAPQELKGKNILLVEDIIDQGVTLATILEKLKSAASSYRVCVLVDKTEDRKRQVKADYIGFWVPKGWVVGFGMDVDQQGRDLPFIGVVDPAVVSLDAKVDN